MDNVLVIEAAALHLGFIGCYGNDWVHTPNLDRLAAEGVVFDRHFADHPRLSGPENPETSSSLTGFFCFPRAEEQQQRAAKPGLLDISKAQGRFSRLLDVRSSPLATADEQVLPAMKPWLAERGGLLWIQGPLLAPPWHVPDDFIDYYFGTETADDRASPWLDPPTGPCADDPSTLERLQTTYAAAVTAFDALVGVIVEELEEAQVLDWTAIMVTASSGLALGEHGYVGGHRAWLHEEIVHVPMIVRLPSAREAGRRIHALTQPADLFPTALQALGLSAAPTDGHSLFPLMHGETESVRSAACSGLAVGYSLEWSMRTVDWAFLLPLSTPPEDPLRQPQLFVKPDDRWEVNDVRLHHLDLAEQLEKQLHELMNCPR
jgi:hypothetical protein